MPKPQSILDRRFSRWTVLGFTYEPGIALCRCACGVVRPVSTSVLTSSAAKHGCGCGGNRFKRAVPPPSQPAPDGGWDRVHHRRGWRWACWRMPTGIFHRDLEKFADDCWRPRSATQIGADMRQMLPSTLEAVRFGAQRGLRVGLMRRRHPGPIAFYQPITEVRCSPELNRLIVKTSGIGDVICEALAWFRRIKLGYGQLRSPWSCILDIALGLTLNVFMPSKLLNVSLPLPMRRWVNTRVTGGEYGSASEYVRQLVRQDQAEHLLEGLDRQLI